MARTQAELMADVRSRIDDENGYRYGDQRVRRFINEILLDVARKTECMPATDTVTAIADQAAYAIPADVIRIHKISYADADDIARGDLDYVDVHNFNLMGTDFSAYNPHVYTQLGFPGSFNFQVHPAPNEAGEFTLHYYALPTELDETGATDANTAVDLPEGWHDVIADGVVYKILQVDRDPRWQEYKGEYMERVMELAELAIRYNTGTGQINGDYPASTLYGHGQTFGRY